MRKSESDAVVSVNAKSPAEEQQKAKEMTELSKMTDSGAAAIVLRDLRKKRSESPTLDPRNASRTPSAAMEPSNKPRYRTPYFACMYVSACSYLSSGSANECTGTFGLAFRCEILYSYFYIV